MAIKGPVNENFASKIFCKGNTYRLISIRVFPRKSSSSVTATALLFSIEIILKATKTAKTVGLSLSTPCFFHFVILLDKKQTNDLIYVKNDNKIVEKEEKCLRAHEENA